MRVSVNFSVWAFPGVSTSESDLIVLHVLTDTFHNYSNSRRWHQPHSSNDGKDISPFVDASKQTR